MRIRLGDGLHGNTLAGFCGFVDCINQFNTPPSLRSIDPRREPGLNRFGKVFKQLAVRCMPDRGRIRRTSAGGVGFHLLENLLILLGSLRKIPSHQSFLF